MANVRQGREQSVPRKAEYRSDIIKPKAREAIGSARGFSREGCSNCGAQYSPQWRSGPGGPRTLCNACGVRYSKGRLPDCPLPSAQEERRMPAEPMSAQLSAEATAQQPNLAAEHVNGQLSAEAAAQLLNSPTELMEGQLSTEAAAGGSSAPAASAVETPEGMPASYSPGLPELNIHFDSTDDEEVTMSDEEELRQLEEAYARDAAQPTPSHASPLGEHGQRMLQPAFQTPPAKDAGSEWVKQASAGLGHALSHLQRQTDALMPVLRMLGPLVVLAARLMPAGKLQYSKVEALMVGLVYGVFASRAVILHSILREKMADDKELQHRTWVLAVTLATWQWAPGSEGSTGQPSGRQDSRQPLSDAQEPSRHVAAQTPLSMGSPMFKQVPKKKRTVSFEADIALSPSKGLEAHSDVEHQTLDQQAAAVPDAAQASGAQHPGTLRQPRMTRARAVQQARPQNLSETRAAAAEEQQAALPPPAVAAEHGIIPQLQQPGQQQPHGLTPMRAPSSHVQQAQAGSSAMPVAHSSSFLLPPPEREFLLLQRTLMPAYQAALASTPGVPADERIYPDEDEEEIDIMSVSPSAEQPAPRRKPGKAPQQKQGGQGLPKAVLLESGLVEGTGGVLCPRSIYTTKQDRAERMLDLQELVKAVGWTHFFSSKVGTRDMCSVLWTLIRQQAAREGPPPFLLSEAPAERKVYTPAYKARFLLQLSHIQTLYWISDEQERGLLDAFCKDVWANRVYECSMHRVRAYEAQGAGQIGQERAEPARTRGIKSLYARQIGEGLVLATQAASGAARAPQPSQEAFTTYAALETAWAPVQSTAADALSDGASAASQVMTGAHLDFAVTQPQGGSAPAAALQVLQPPGLPAPQADARCAVTWQPPQLDTHEARASSQHQGLQQLAQDQSCKPAVETEEQLACVQAAAGGTSAPEQEVHPAPSAPAKGVAAAKEQAEKSINKQAPGREVKPTRSSAPATGPSPAAESMAEAVVPASKDLRRGMSEITLGCELSRQDTIVGKDGQSHPRTVFRARDGRLMLELRELAQAVGWQVRAKEGTRDLCIKLWHKARAKAQKLGIPHDALAGLPCFIRRPLKTHYLLGLEHVQTLYLLATDMQRRGLDDFCKDVWPGQYEASMQEISQRQAGPDEQAGASTAVGAGIAPAPLPAAKRGDETQVPPQQGSMQLPPSSQQVSPNAQKGSETLQMAPGPDQGMQEQQQQELIQVKLQLPGMAARAVALLRGPEETAVCLRQLFDTFADRIPSWRALSRKAGWEGGERWATAEERLFLIRVGALAQNTDAATVLTLPAALRVLRHFQFAHRELAAIAALHLAPALTAVQLGKLPAAGAAPDNADETLGTRKEDAAGQVASMQPVPLPLPGCGTPDRHPEKHGCLPPQHEHTVAAAQDASAVAAYASAPMGSSNTITAPAQAAKVSRKRARTDKPAKQQPAAGASSDAAKPPEAAKISCAPAVLLQAQLQLPGMAARAMAVIRGPEESTLCMRQLLTTIADRLPSEIAFYRAAKLEGGQRWATPEERLFLIRVVALGQQSAAAIVLALPAAVRVLRRCGFTEGELAAVAALHDAPALTAAQLGELAAAGAVPDEADARHTASLQPQVPEQPQDCSVADGRREKHDSLPPQRTLAVAPAQDASAVAAHASAPLGSSKTTASAQPGPESLHDGATVSRKRKSADRPGKQQPAVGASSDTASLPKAIKGGSAPAMTGKRRVDAAATVRMRSPSAQKGGERQPAAGASSDAVNPPEAAKAGSAPAATGKRHAEASPTVRVTRARLERADQQQAAGGAWVDAIAVQSAGAKPCAPKRPRLSAPCLQVDSQRQQVHDQRGNADPGQPAPKPEQPEQEAAQPELLEFDLKRDLRVGHAFLIRTEEDDISKGWDKPWSVGKVTRLRKDKTKADVLWLKPKSKGAMWSSKWVPFEVEVFTPKKSRVDRIPWRSEFLDTGCFVCGTKLQEDGTFAQEDQVMMAQAAKYVEGLAKSVGT